MGLRGYCISSISVRNILRTALTLLGSGLVVVGLVAPAASPAQASAGINKTINFQGRLLTNTGAVVPDGNYNFRLKVYQDGDGLSAADATGSPSGSLMWTELWQNSVATGSSSGIAVKNGYFSVNLGSYCAFIGGSCQANTNSGVNFDQDTLWLSMDVGGTVVSNTPTYDGEMLPMKRLSSSVYALQAANADSLGGISSSGYIQNIAPNAAQQTANFNILSGAATTVAAAEIQSVASATAPVVILKGGATPGTGADLLQLQNSSGSTLDSFDSSGNLTLGNNSDKTISVATASSANGNNLTVTAGSGNGTTKNGGNLVLEAGAATAGGVAGAIVVKPQTDSTTSLQIETSGGSSVLTVDTLNDKVAANDLALGSAADVGAAGHLFSDGFEQGNGEAWTATGGTGTVSTQSAIARSGKYAEKFVTSGTSAYMQVTTTSNSTLYGRTYFDATSAGNPTPLMDFGTGGIWSGTHLYLYLGASGNLCYNYNAGAASACSSTAPLASTWHKLETRMTIGTGANGILQVWLDGTLVNSNSNAINISNGAWTVNSTNFAIGGSANSTATVYYDDVVVDDVPTGDSAALYTADSLHVSGTSSISVNSPGAFSVQNAAGSNLFNIDTTNGILGTQATAAASTNSNDILFASGSASGATSNSGNVTIDSGTATGTTGGINIGTLNTTAIVIGKNSNSPSFDIKTGSGAVNVSEDGSRSHTVNISNSSSSAASITQTINIGNPTSENATSDATNVTIGPSGTALGTTVLQAEGISDTLTGSASAPTDVIKSGTNSTTVFQVQNSSAVPLFTADTTNERLYVGPTAGDTVGALLVLGNKNNAGDPTGVAGAIYYNSSLGLFRCYENSIWKNCIGLDADNQRVEPFYSTDLSGATNYSPWSINPVPNTGDGTFSQVAGQANHPGIMLLGSVVSPSVANDGAAITTLASTGTSARSSTVISGGESTEVIFSPQTLDANTQTYLGFIDNNNGTAPANGVYISITNATLSGKATAASTSSSTGSTDTLTQGDWYRARIVMNGAGTTATYSVWDTTTGGAPWTDTVSTNIPTVGTSNGIESFYTTAGVGKTLMYVDYLAEWYTGRSLNR